MTRDDFSLLYSVWKQLGSTDFAFFLKVIALCADVDLSYYGCEYCSWECMWSGEAAIRQLTQQTLERLDKSKQTDRFLWLLELLLCKCSLSVRPVHMP